MPSVGNTFGNPSYAGVFHTAYAISPTCSTKFPLTTTATESTFCPLGLVSAPSGFTFAPFFPHTGDGANVDNRIPSVQLNGSTGANYTSNWTPWNNKADSYQIRDDLSWTQGTSPAQDGRRMAAL